MSGGTGRLAYDGCRSVKVRRYPRNQSWLGKINAGLRVIRYPVIQLMTLCEAGHGS